MKNIFQKNSTGRLQGDFAYPKEPIFLPLLNCPRLKQFYGEQGRGAAPKAEGANGRVPEIRKISFQNIN